MSRNFVINRVYINNFKNITDLDIFFNGSKLVVLDGPNGYGKTTIFDAVELVLTGQISRVENTLGNIGFNKLFFSNNSEDETVIKIEFADNITQKKFTLCKKTENTKSLLKSQRKPQNWEVFSTYFLEEFESEEFKPINQEYINQKFGGIDLTRYFKLFYYVQQQDTAFFLKKKGQDRMKELSKLFDTDKESEEREKILNKIVDLKSFFSKLNSDIEDETKKLNSLDAGEQNKEAIQYVKLSPKDSFLWEWDRENPQITKTNLGKYINDLRDIYILKNNQELFFRVQKNKKMEEIINNEVLLETLIYGNILEENGEKIKNNLKLQNQLTKLLEVIKALDSNSTSEFPIKLLRAVNLFDEHFIKELEIQLKQNQKIRIITDDLGVLVGKISAVRKTLKDHFVEFHSKTEDTYTSCPMCGNPFTTMEELLMDIENQETYFRGHLDDNGSNLLVENRVLMDKYYRPIKKLLEDELLIYDKMKLDDKIKKMSELSNYFRKRETISSYLITEGIDIGSYVINDLNEYDKIEKQVELLKERLSLSLFELLEEYNQFENNQRTFSNLMDSDEENLIEITLDKIKQKAEYIKYEYYNANNEEKEKLTEKINILKVKKDNLQEIIASAEKIDKIYEESIVNHWKEIIKEIEIPFYIYSSKIIQNYQNGAGFFIGTSDISGNKTIRFTSEFDREHDAINYLSSGQLSALVIAFSLALNKMYDFGKFQTILIDDPTQTMDDLNMVSLLDLLRNEFISKQLFLSTHEDSKSQFMTYKYHVYGEKNLSLNMKDLYLKDRE